MLTSEVPSQLHEPLPEEDRPRGFAFSPLSFKQWPLLVATTTINLLGLALPIFILQIYDRVLPQQATTTLFVLIFGLAIALIFETILRALRSYLALWNGARFEHFTRFQAVERLLRAPMGVLERETPGAHLEKINAVSAVRDFYSSQFPLILIDIPFAIFFLGLIAWLGGWLVLVPLTLIAVFGLLAVAIGRALRRSVAGRVEVDKQRYDFLIEILRAVHTVKALALNSILLRRHETLQDSSDQALRRMTYQSGLSQTMGTLFNQLALVLIVAFGAVLVLDGSMTMGGLAACTLLSGRALQPLQTTMDLWTSFQRVRVAQEQLGEVMTLPSERAAREYSSPTIRGSVTLRDVGYSREPDARPVLEGVDLAVKPGEIVGIEGDPGSGKSTLLLLVLGLLKPDHGSILIDGHESSGIDPDWLRRSIALLPQQGAMYGGTILDNLTNFQEGECVNEALYLAYLLGLDEAIKRLPEGFDTRVGVGENLPAGLRQRIAIIREMIKRPKILLFDDADQALDSDGSRRLIELLRQLGKQTAILLVSSKPQVLQIANRRYRLSQGRLVPISAATGKAQVQAVGT